MKPNLYVVAGPNGAGKSLFSATLVDTDFEVFDGDKYISRLQHQFPEIGSDVLNKRVNEIDFQEAKENAIQAQGNFAFETNFSSEDPTFSVRQFKAAGYNVHLVFMGVDTLEECIQRVDIRVRSGGHKVTEDSIEYNFKHGYKNLYAYYAVFDTVTLYENSIAARDAQTVPQKLLFLKKTTVKVYPKELPSWAQKFLQVIQPKSKKIP
jgi:predicted ABC-type ATPase